MSRTFKVVRRSATHSRIQNNRFPFQVLGRNLRVLITENFLRSRKKRELIALRSVPAPSEGWFEFDISEATSQWVGTAE